MNHANPHIPALHNVLEQMRDALHLKQYSRYTEEAYIDWISRYVSFHHSCDPHNMGIKEIKVFLTHLAVEQNVAPSTQNQALSALLFLHLKVLKQTLPRRVHTFWAKQPQRLPTIMAPTEVQHVLAQLSGTYLLMAQLLYGSGLRVRECMRLRIKDLDVARHTITVRNSNGLEDRCTVMPLSLTLPLQHHLRKIKGLHDDALTRGYGRAYLPAALRECYPNADKEWEWHYVFPARKHALDPHSGHICRHHRNPSGLQKTVKQAVRKAEITKYVTCQTFRDSFAAHLLEMGYNIRIVQELLGHKNVKTTLKYTRVLPLQVKSPLD